MQPCSSNGASCVSTGLTVKTASSLSFTSTLEVSIILSPCSLTRIFLVSNQNVTANIIKVSRIYDLILILLLKSVNLLSKRPYLLKMMIDGVIKTANQPKLLLNTILLPLSLYAFMTILINLIFRLYEYASLTLFPKLKSDITIGMFTYLSNHSYSYFTNHFSGSLSKKIFDLSTGIEPIIQIPYTTLLPKVLAILIASCVLYTIHPLFGVALALWTCGFVTTSFLMSKKSEKMSYTLSESENTVGGRIVDSITNIISTKLFSNFSHEKSILNSALNQFVAKDRLLQMNMLKIHFIQALWVIVLILLMLAGLVYGRLNHWVTVGDFALILNLSGAIAMNVYSTGEEMVRLSKEIGKCRQALNVIVEAHEIKDKPDAKDLEIKSGEIVFENVKFQYQNAGPFFENKSITIKPGQKVGLVGHSGSGKSSFVNLILRLFDLNHGRILIDRQDISCITQDSLRKAIGMIPQDPSLFHRTIMDNIRYGCIEASDEEVMHAAKLANASQFVSLLPNGFSTLVGEKGVKLSGGQRQRIAIARAFLKNAPILILDEATSQLDSITENYIQASLNNLMKGKTSIVIAHRLSTLLHMDRILVFENGKIVEDGTHQVLLAYNGRYKALWDAQVGGFLTESIESRITVNQNSDNKVAESNI
jgi:ATP-binding cassette subfamily B protein